VQSYGGGEYKSNKEEEKNVPGARDALRLGPLPLLLPTLFPSLFDASASPFEMVAVSVVNWTCRGSRSPSASASF
jgi:hypothetical protein